MAGKSTQRRGMEEDPENGKEYSYPAHANGMNGYCIDSMLHGVRIIYFVGVNVVYNITFERGEEVKYLETTLTDENYIEEEIKNRLRLRNACYHLVQNLMSSRLLSRNLKIKIYRNIILPVVLYGCETWSLTLWEERKLRVFENRVLRRIFGPRRDEAAEDWRRLHNEELNYLYTSPNIVRVIKSRRMRWAGHVAHMG